MEKTIKFKDFSQKFKKNVKKYANSFDKNLNFC